MRYAICDKDKSLAAGFRELGHRVKGEEMLLNEREVILSPHLSGTFEERVSSLGGRAYTLAGAHHYVNQNKWK